MSLRAFAASLVLLAFVSPVAAQQARPSATPAPTPAVTAAPAEPAASHIAAAREFLDASGGATVFQGVIPGMVEQVRGAFLQSSPELAQPLQEVAIVLAGEFGPRAGELIEDMARAYARRFTEPELRELAAFYRGALGRKLLSESPGAIQESFGRAQQWSQQVSQEMMSRMRAEMRRRGFPL